MQHPIPQTVTVHLHMLPEQRATATKVAGSERTWVLEASDLRLAPGQWPHLIHLRGAEHPTLARCHVERDADNDVRWVDFTDTFGRNTVRIFND